MSTNQKHPIAPSSTSRFSFLCHMLLKPKSVTRMTSPQGKSEMSSPTNLLQRQKSSSTAKQKRRGLTTYYEKKILSYPNIWEDEKAWFSSFVEVISPHSFAYLGCCQTIIDKALIEKGRKRRRNGAYVGNYVPLNSITSDSARSTTIRVDT